MQILFVHGAGGWDDDQPIIEGLRRRTGLPVHADPFGDEDMSAATWRGLLARRLEPLGPDVILVGHSFGASMALQHVADPPADLLPAGLALLAMPDWGPQGWDVAEYALPDDAHVPTGLPVWLHHCRDDAVVPVDHVELHRRRLPRARVRRHDTGGHQLEGRLDAVADDLLDGAAQRDV